MSTIFWALALLQDPQPGPPLTFAVYGDFRTGHDTHSRIVARMAEARPAFILTAGDHVAEGSDPGDWKKFREITADLQKQIIYYPARGNHDKGPDDLYLAQFDLPLARPYYSISRANLQIVVIDSTTLLVDDFQFDWIRRVLSEGRPLRRFAVLHHPPFTLLKRRSSESEAFRKKLHSLFVERGVGVVFSGHDHLFAHTRRDGVHYVISGGGGAPLYEPDADLLRPGEKAFKGHHFLLVTVEERRVWARAIDPDGRELHRFDLGDR
jgi:predicted phosphodiesterase